jgi:hypothetical protein
MLIYNQNAEELTLLTTVCLRHQQFELYSMCSILDAKYLRA